MLKKDLAYLWIRIYCPYITEKKFYSTGLRSLWAQKIDHKMALYMIGAIDPASRMLILKPTPTMMRAFDQRRAFG